MLNIKLTVKEKNALLKMLDNGIRETNSLIFASKFHNNEIMLAKYTDTKDRINSVIIKLRSKG